ncbi:MAG: peptidylprolyl isomerase [Myxococcota bacterium]
MRMTVTLLSLAGLLVSSGAHAEAPVSPKDLTVIDRIVAVVGSEPITLYELNRATGPYVQRLRASGENITNIHAEKVRREILESLVDERLMLEEARRMKLEVNPAEIDAEIEGLKAKRGWDDIKLATVLAQAGFPSTGQYRKHREKQRLIDQVLNFRVRGRVRIDEAAVATAVKTELDQAGGLLERRAAHILMRADEFVTPEKIAEITAKLAGIRNQILAGEVSFEDAARLHSEDPAGRAGGDTGWFSKGEFAPSFERAVGTLAVGQVSPPVRTEFGFHLIKLIDQRRQEVSPQKRQELTAKIRTRMLQEESAELYKEWLQSLRRDAFIELRSLSDAAPTVQ